MNLSRTKPEIFDINSGYEAKDKITIENTLHFQGSYVRDYWRRLFVLYVHINVTIFLMFFAFVFI